MNRYRTHMARPLIYAALFHLLLVCVFALIRMDTLPRAKEYFEVALAQSPPKGSDLNIDDTERRRRQQLAGSKAVSGSKVDLPERRMLLDEDEVAVPVFDEKVADATSGDVGGKVTQAEYDRDERNWSPTGSDASTGKRGVSEFDDNAAKRNKIFEFGSRQGTPGSAFRLEWVTGGNRKLLKQINPQYPPGINRETVIRLKFRVMPDGTVDRIIPVRKGDPRLEEITLKAFRAWLFEPLSPSAEQTPQDGFVTFIFKLK